MQSNSQIEGEKNEINNSDQNKTLNWKQYLCNENTLTDSLKFKHWDQNLEIPEKQTLIKDLTRTRNDDPFFKKESVQKDLQLLATFYCQQNNVDYQQGMLEIVIPFRLLKTADFPLGKCYAYFNTFMNEYFPKVLEQRIIGKSKELAHVLSAIQFCEMLLKYHCARLYRKLCKIEEFQLSMVVTQWIMTLFAKNTPMSLVFLIFDKYMRRKNQNYIFYLSVALFKIKAQEIDDIITQDSDMLLPYINKKLKQLNTESDVAQFFSIADAISAQTPNSFGMLIAQTTFHDHTIQSVEDVQELINLKDSVYSKTIFMFSQNLFDMFTAQNTQQTNHNQKSKDKKIEIRLLDIREARKIKLRQIINKKFIIKSKKEQFKLKKDIEISVKRIIQETPEEIHICLIGDSQSNYTQAIEVSEIFFQNGRNYVSILYGGFDNLEKFCLKKTSTQAKDKDCVIM